jgi:hypothetical protein
MDIFERLPRAASAALPALADFLQPFHLQFGRRESQAALERYLTGRLTDHPRKNCDTLAAILPDTSEQQLKGGCGSASIGMRRCHLGAETVWRARQQALDSPIAQSANSRGARAGYSGGS